MTMNAFKNAFDGKWDELSEKLDVNLCLLSCLYDRKVLTYRHFETLNVIEGDYERANKLLRVLLKRDDSLFDVFCKVLEKVDQFSIVKIIQPEAQRTLPIAGEAQHVTRLHSICVSQERLVQTKDSQLDKKTIELEEILEVDYGLPDVLYKKKVLTLPQCQDIAQHCLDQRCKVQQRVSYLLNFAVEKLKKGNENVLRTLNTPSFLKSLNETYQPHIAKFIEVDGEMESISDDAICPLNEHQRISLHPCLGVTEETFLDARNLTLQAMLLGERVISRTQQEYLTAGAPCSTTSNKRLLLIMARRSVADVKRFFCCLVRMGQIDVVDKLNVPGIYVCIHTTINEQTMSNEDKQKRESHFVKFFNRLRWKGRKSDRRKKLEEACAPLDEKECVCKGVQLKQSIAWFIHCQTLHSLLSLREMYYSNELAHVLHDIFNAIRGRRESLPLRVEWGAENYEICRAILEKPATLPFDTLSYDDELLRKTGASTLDALPPGVLEVILLKAYKILYNVLRMAPHESFDVVTRGVMPPFAVQIALSSVCFKWWKDKSSGSGQVLPLQQATARLTAVSHVISSDGRGAVGGVAIYSDKLFVLREESEGRIEQFDVKTFQEEESIKVNGLSDDGGLWWYNVNGWWCKSMTSCDINSCLYISDSFKVFRVNPFTEDVISWPVGGSPCGLSVNETRNVLVTCIADDTIKEYTTHGSFVRSIKLQVNHVRSPFHCIQLTDSRFVVCHRSPVRGVSEIDKHGTLIATYRNSETTKLEMKWPRCVILFNDSLLVADMRNDRILLLNTSLSDARLLSLPFNSQLSRPCCMYLEQSRGRLFVGEDSGRVLVIDNIDLK